MMSWDVQVARSHHRPTLRSMAPLLPAAMLVVWALIRAFV